MNLIGKLQPVIIITAAFLGLLLGAVTPLGSVSSSMIEVFLMMLLYILFLSIDLKQIKKSFTNIRFTLSAVIINFVFTPLFGYLLGKVFFPGSLDIRIGLLMLLVTPCTDWYLVFTGLSKGNVELGMSILPLNLILQIVLLPVYLLVLIGSEVTMDVGSLVSSVSINCLAARALLPHFPSANCSASMSSCDAFMCKPACSAKLWTISRYSSFCGLV